ncbi:hypothetical protein BSKO_02004 [Bryopsis sp. KO-2023]|nr:hypothetical protein BSKO_02004 [Bryopsis sp. KO-2023]
MGVAMDALSSFSTDLGLGVLATSLMPFCLMPPLHHHIRSVAKPLVSRRVAETAGFVSQVQELNSPKLSSLISLCNSTVSTEFYVVLLSLLAWTGNMVLAGRVGYLISLSLYFGNAMKDMVGAPRPFAIPASATKPRVKFQGAEGEIGHVVEHGLPSSHVMNSLTLVLYMLHTGLEAGTLNSEKKLGMYLVGLLWVAWIGWGRLYCGMHSLLDLISGWFNAILVYRVFVHGEPILVSLFHSGMDGLVRQLIVAMLLLSVYPKPERYTPSYEYAVTIFGGVWGMMCGRYCLERWMVGGAEINSGFAGYRWDSWGVDDFFTIGCRAVVGFAMMGVVKVATKPALKYLFSWVFRLFPVGVRGLWQPPIGVRYETNCSSNGSKETKLLKATDGTYWDVDISTRFVSYALVGGCCGFGCWLAFDALGLK